MFTNVKLNSKFSIKLKTKELNIPHYHKRQIIGSVEQPNFILI